jgi:HD-GYP domain-containing protein (c-di-GMP phosphodiesterase class II)
MAKHARLSRQRTVILEHSALLHDIGTAGVHASILNKEGDLTDDEQMEMGEHVIFGAQMLTVANQQLHKLGYSQEQISTAERLSKTGRQTLSVMNEIIACHHRPLCDMPEMPVEARILAVADEFDALVTGRSYLVPQPVYQALVQLEDDSPRRYDPKAVEWLRQALKSRKRFEDA